jgi:DNA-binding transcriptional MerR regulator
LTKSTGSTTFQIKFSNFDSGAIDSVDLLSDDEMGRLERERSGGISSGEVVRLFEARGARLSASTFRKYVQLGLLPRSRRVGRKGKHSGSTGLYPVAVVRRIALLKRMMAEGYTLDDIRGSFVTVRNRLEDVEQGLAELVASIAVKARAHPRKRQFEAELVRAEREARAAFRRLERVGGAVTTIGAAEAAGSRDPGAGAALVGR